MNETECRSLGYSREELLCMSVLDIDPVFDDAARAVFNKNLREMGRARFEGVHRRKDGWTFPVEVSITSINLDRPYLLTIARDITERKLAEKALRASEAEFHSLAESMPQIVWITGPDGGNIYFNQQWTDYTGLTLEESLGDGWNRPFHPDDQQAAWNAWQNATQHSDNYANESRLRRADGTCRWWLVRGVPLLDDSGNILNWFGTRTDIHDLKMAVLKISNANLKLRESERRFSDMLEMWC